ncbi:MAG: hypothetical protein ACFFDX_01205 [Candidatus Odinarchaeota archaeon]
MPEDNEKVDDFISLWKKKMSSDDKSPSVIRDTLNKMSALQQENEELRKKITQNIDLISRSEEIIRKSVEEKEKFKLEKEGALKDLEQENLELSNKVKSMVKLLLEKDEEIKKKDSQLSRSKGSGVSSESLINQTLIDDLKTELSRKISQISELELKISELTDENEVLHQQLVEKIKNLPIDYVVPVDDEVIKPQPPETPSLPLEQLCQDLQADLNKYKKVIEKLTNDKSQLKQALENKGYKFDAEEIASLRTENEALKKDLEDLQKVLKREPAITSPETSLGLETKIKELESKLSEKEDLITQLKLSQLAQGDTDSGPMAQLVEELQKQINKLKVTLKEKDQKIAELQNK